VGEGAQRADEGAFALAMQLILISIYSLKLLNA
jgi:hypothetical protein